MASTVTDKLPVKDILALRRAVANPETPAETLTELAAVHDSLTEALAAVAGHPNCSSALMGRLARRDVKVRQALAANPSCPSRVFDKLCADRSVPVVEALASNPSLSPAHQLAVVQSGHSGALRQIASRLDLGVDAGLELVACGDPNSIRTLACNPCAPQVVLEALARRRVGGGYRQASRDALAGNPASGPGVLQALWEARSPSGLEDVSLATMLAVRRESSDELIAQLPVSVVARYATARLALPEGLFEGDMALEFSGTVGELRELCENVLAHPA
jgi:hypothetical protein